LWQIAVDVGDHPLIANQPVALDPNNSPGRTSQPPGRVQRRAPFPQTAARVRLDFSLAEEEPGMALVICYNSVEGSVIDVNLELKRLEVGPWPMNCYLVRCRVSGEVAIVDPGAGADAILAAVGDAPVRCVLLTHAHPDHVGALDAVCQATAALIGVHPADAAAFEVRADFPLLDGMEVEVGRSRLTVVHVPGHTPGSVCLRLNGQVVVGDAIFPGGPGHTVSPEALAQSLVSLGQVVFAWPDETELYPGHGAATTVGAERAAFERFIAEDHPPDLCGDVAWR
jgi:hydroxyacylglutathione hydrolase